MSATRHQKLKDIYSASFQLPENERARFLDEACGDDQALRDELELLFQAEAKAGDFMAKPVLDGAALLNDVADAPRINSTSPLPITIGRYRVIRLIGEGGMGRVYEAEQDTPRRRVAIKVIRSPLWSPRLAQRFAHEAEILARLRHPSIAQVYDAGVAEVHHAHAIESDVPFIVMELIDGLSLTDFARQQHLNDRQRLELLIQVCDAVHHGHQQGVIHRDLKPANILVETSGTAKVIDFGVARATNADVAMATMHTDAGQILGTLAYMSPEQVSAEPQQIDARSDIYSLGVIGFELLTERHPYDLAGLLVPQAARRIQEAEPVRMSSISRIYRGDIETIIGKAIEKEPARRYQSASELSADIRRYCNDEPIMARPPTMRYHLVKFARRHRELVAGLVLAILMLIGGLAAVTMALARAMAGERESTQQSSNLQAVNQFLLDMLGSADPQAAGQPEMTVRAALDRAAARLEAGDLSDQPQVAASIRYVLGQAYKSISRYDEARTQLEESLEVRREGLGIDHPDSIAAAKTLASVYAQTMQFGIAADLYEETLKSIGKLAGPQSEDAASTLETLGGVYSQDLQFERAMSCFDRAMDIRRKLYPFQDARLVEPMLQLARFKGSRGEIIEGEALYREAFETLQSQEERDEATMAAAQTDRTNLLQMLGRFDDAEQAGRFAYDTYRRIFGNDHAYVISAEGWLSLTLQSMGRFDEAEPMMRHVNDLALNVYGELSYPFAGSLMRLGALEIDRGNHEDALAQLTRAREIVLQLGGPNQPLAIALAESGMAQAMLRMGRLDEAGELAARAVDARRRSLPPNAPSLAPPLTTLGIVLIEQGDSSRAEAVIREALTIRELRTPEHWQIHQLRSLLGAALAGQGVFKEAEPLLVNANDQLQRMPYVPVHEREQSAKRVQAFLSIQAD